MKALATTAMSAKGQIVIPAEIREKFGLRSGVRFEVLIKNHTIILKALGSPTMKEFEGVLRKIRAQARKVKLKKSDLKQAIIKTRKKYVEGSH